MPSDDWNENIDLALPGNQVHDPNQLLETVDQQSVIKHERQSDSKAMLEKTPASVRATVLPKNKNDTTNSRKRARSGTDSASPSLSGTDTDDLGVSLENFASFEMKLRPNKRPKMYESDGESYDLDSDASDGAWNPHMS